MKKMKYCGLEWDTANKKKIYTDSGNNTGYYETGQGLTVIDIDSLKTPKELKLILGKLKPTTKTKRGSHYYFKHDASINYKNRAKLGKDENIDIRGEGGKIFATYSGDSENISYEHNPKNIYKLDDHPMVKLYLDDIAVNIHTPKENIFDESAGDMSIDDVLCLLDKVDVQEYTVRDQWIGMIASIYKCGGEKVEDIAREWSKGDPEQYDEKSFDNIWQQCVNGKFGDGYSKGTLIRAANGEKKDPTELFGKEKGNVFKINREITSLDDIFGDTYMTPEDYQKIEDQKYLIKDFIPDQGFGILAGKESSGKSWITFYLSNLILEKYADKKVSFFDIDSGAVYSKTRSTYLMNKYGNRFKYYSQHKGENAKDLKIKLQQASELDLIEQIIIVDSLIGLTDGKLNGSEDIKPILNTMEGLRNAGATVILIHHEKKDGGYAGSFAIGGAVDFMYGVKKDNDIITLDLKKDRGKYQAHTIKVTDFDSCEGDEIAYISGDVFKAEEERKFKAEEQRIKDEEYIRAITDVIKNLKSNDRKPNKELIASEVHKDIGTNRKTTIKILHRYEDSLWKCKIIKNKGKAGRPSKVYKLL